MLKAKLKKLIHDLEKENIPQNIIAWHFDLHEPYSLQLVGATSYDEDDEDWACETGDDFRPKHSYIKLDFLEDLPYEEVLDMVVSAIRELKTNMAEAKIFGYEHIAVGFFDGDLVLI